MARLVACFDANMCIILKDKHFEIAKKDAIMFI
jgi:hypothetical protein